MGNERKVERLKKISLLIKPSSGACNQACSYCFYHALTDCREQKDHGPMSLETLEQVVIRAFETGAGCVQFVFQGGEPSLRGLDFFMEFERQVVKHNTKKAMVQRCFQTNGTLLDESWCMFFREHGYLVGISLDGPRDIHDRFRKDNAGNGTHHLVMQAIAMLEHHGVEVNVLCVVTGESARQGKLIYGFFREQGILNIQFIHCLDKPGQLPGEEQWQLPWRRYHKFLKDVFDEWYRDWIRDDACFIRLFDNYLMLLQGMEPEACGMLGCCSCQFVVESDGSVYPCDFYALDEWKAGNVNKDSLMEMAESPAVMKFIGESLVENPKCLHCKWRSLCWNGCKRDREGNANRYCEATYNFLEYAGERLDYLAGMLSQTKG
ncbi:MAG: radical SAM protein [Clostridia bacterium]